MKDFIYFPALSKFTLNSIQDPEFQALLLILTLARKSIKSSVDRDLSSSLHNNNNNNNNNNIISATTKRVVKHNKALILLFFFVI